MNNCSYLSNMGNLLDIIVYTFNYTVQLITSLSFDKIIKDFSRKKSSNLFIYICFIIQ